MRVRRKFALLLFLAVSAGAGAQAQKLVNAPRQPRRAAKSKFTKELWLSLSAATYMAAALDMHATANAADVAKRYPAMYWGNPEANPIARPFVNLPRPAYYASGFALATGVNWLGYRMSRSRKWRKVWWLPQSISISANGFGYLTNH